MRLCVSHDAPGVEVFVYGAGGGPFPARQHIEASAAVARAHRLDPARTLVVEQSPAAIAAGAFHNDVVAVANGQVLFAHEHAFADRDAFYADLRQAMPEVEIVEVADADVPLADAIRSYLFNAQLVTLPDGEMALIAPIEARDTPSVAAWLSDHVAGNGPIRRVEYVDVRESMANGGGPACLRLRVVCDPATVDPRFLVDPERLDLITSVVRAEWPEQIAQGDIANPELIAQIERAHATLFNALGLSDLLTGNHIS